MDAIAQREKLKQINITALVYYRRLTLPQQHVVTTANGLEAKNFGIRTIAQMDTIPNGHKPEWTQSRMGTIPNGHNPEWTQSRMDTITNGHNLEWAQARMDTIPNGHNSWTRS